MYSSYFRLLNDQRKKYHETSLPKNTSELKNVLLVTAPSKHQNLDCEILQSTHLLKDSGIFFIISSTSLLRKINSAALCIDCEHLQRLNPNHS